MTLGYDEENRLVSAGSVSYTYDLLGRRLSRSYGGVTTTYVWDGAHIIAEYTGGSLTKKYIYGPGMDNPVAMVDGETEDWYYYFTDALGSVRLLSDAGGSIVEGYTYDPYGQPRVMASGGDGNWLTEDGTTYSSSSYGNPYMFTGRRWDSVTSLYYYRFRDYSPYLGRFMQTDPAGYIDTMNLYAYCGNNPVNWIDPWGLDKNQQTAGGVAVGVVATGVALSPEAAAAAGAVIETGGVIILVAGAAVGGYAVGDYIEEQTGIGDAIGTAIGEALTPIIAKIAEEIDERGREHRKNKRKSNREKHQRGRRRKSQDRRGGEKGDIRRPY